MAIKKYKIKNTNLLHDGHTYKIGDTIELDEEKAEKLEDVLTCIGNAETKTTNKANTNTKSKTETNTKNKAETKNQKTETVNETAQTDTDKTEGDNNGK